MGPTRTSKQDSGNSQLTKERYHSGYKEYHGFTLYPFHHKLEKMPWGAATVLQMDKIEKMIWLAGATGRDPETDRQPKNREEARNGVGKVVGGIKEQTVAAWTRIKELLEGLGANLEDIIFIHTYLVKRNDFWDMAEARDNFFREYCPDLLENRRPGTLIKDIGLDLPDMLIEVEVVAALGKK